MDFDGSILVQFRLALDYVCSAYIIIPIIQNGFLFLLIQCLLLLSRFVGILCLVLVLLFKRERERERERERA